MTLAHMQLFPFLRSVYGELTKTEKRIADYMMNNAMQVMDQKITDIAKHTQSSEITVSRFCKKSRLSWTTRSKKTTHDRPFSSFN